MGITSGGRLVELLRTKDGMTWTLIVTAPNGMACLIASGESWQIVEALLGEQS